MHEASPESGAGRAPVAVFLAALAAAATKERASRTRREERVAAVSALSDADLATLVDQFAAMLRGEDELAALTEGLHAGLRALAPETDMDVEADDA